MKSRAEASRSETSTLEKSKWKGVYFKNSLAALLALSAPEPPPSFLPLVLLLDLPLEPFFEVSPDFSRCFLASFAILSIMRPDHVPSSDIACYQCSYPIQTFPNTWEFSARPGPIRPLRVHRPPSSPAPMRRQTLRDPTQGAGPWACARSKALGGRRPAVAS
jgi:hypothetical protein